MDFINCKYPRHQLIINDVANSSPGPDRVTFVITTIIYSSSPPLILAPRFWEPRDQPQPGFSLEARQRALGTRLLNGNGRWEQQKKPKTTTTITIGLIMSKMSVVLDYEWSPIFLMESKASETRARVKITPRKNRRHAAGREIFLSLSPPRVAFSCVGWFSRALAYRSLYYPWGKMGDYS